MPRFAYDKIRMAKKVGFARMGITAYIAKRIRQKYQKNAVYSSFFDKQKLQGW